MKNKLNNKGFTLIELLAVIVVLLLISTIAISSINAAVERNKAKQRATKISVIESYAKLYYEAHKNSVANNSCIQLGWLDLTENENKDPVSGGTFSGGVKVTGAPSNPKFQYKEPCT